MTDTGELDTWLAERLGWERGTAPTMFGDRMVAWRAPDEEAYNYDRTPDYSTDWEDMGALLAYMRGQPQPVRERLDVVVRNLIYMEIGRVSVRPDFLYLTPDILALAARTALELDTVPVDMSRWDHERHAGGELPLS